MTSKILPIRRNTRGADLTKLPTRYDARFLEELQVMKLRLSYVTHLLTCRDRPTDRPIEWFNDWLFHWLIDFPLRNTTPTPQKYIPTILSSFLLFLSRSSRSVLRLLLLSSPVEQRGNQKWSRVHKEAGAYDTMQLWKSKSLRSISWRNYFSQISLILCLSDINHTKLMAL